MSERCECECECVYDRDNIRRRYKEKKRSILHVWLAPITCNCFATNKKRVIIVWRRYLHTTASKEERDIYIQLTVSYAPVVCVCARFSCFVLQHRANYNKQGEHILFTFRFCRSYIDDSMWFSCWPIGWAIKSCRFSDRSCVLFVLYQLDYNDTNYFCLFFLQSMN